MLMLTDYLTPHIFQIAPAAGRLPAVAYNPRKIPAPLYRLLATKIGHPCVPLEGMDKPTLASLLRELRVYADFGPHPGRDRLPREAALSGAVVITGRRGAAAFPADVPLPNHFRLDEAAPDFDARLLAVIRNLLQDEEAFLQARAEQQSYRNWIEANQGAFTREVNGLIAVLTGGTSLAA
ncbi:MAG: hypothetical protein ACJ8AI_25200 [Rhodopila sp.]